MKELSISLNICFKRIEPFFRGFILEYKRLALTVTIIGILMVGIDTRIVIIGIGGAGTFDGVFLSGIIAVLIAGL